jgi:hypothetical protein
LLGNRQRVVDFDSEISSRAFNLAVPQEKLNSAEIAGSPIDQSRFGSAKRVGAEELRIQSNFGDPRRDESRIFPGGYRRISATAGEQEIAWLLAI